MERNLAIKAHKHKEGMGGYRKIDLENERKKSNEHRLQQIAIRDKMLNDPELNTRIITLMEKCKAKNIEKLRSYGLEI
jgi:hypothetical protein